MTFSVVVPTHNRCELLQHTIESIQSQDFRDFEIIVVDDGSSDGTDHYLNQLNSYSNITHIRQSNLGPARARNAGIGRSRGEFVAFTDDDCVVPPDWLTQYHRAFASEELDVAGGSVNNAAAGIFSESSQEMTNYLVRSLAARESATSFLTSNNIAYRASSLKKYGAFDERFARAGGEERALNMKILAGGGKSRFLPESTIEHYHRMTFGSFLHQQMNYGRGSYLIYRVIGRELGSPPNPIPPGTYAGMFASFFRDGFLGGCVKTGIAIIAQAAVLTGYIAQAAAPRTLHSSASR